MTITLPWPPSVNTYWRNLSDRVLISRKGRTYRQNVQAAVLEQRADRFGAAVLCMSIGLHPPDNRERDIDNYLKALLDSLQHAGVYDNDSQIKRIVIDMLKPKKPGKAVVSIRPKT